MASMKEDINVPFIATLAIISTVLVVVVVIGTQAWFLYEEQREVAVKWDMPSHSTLAQTNQQQLANISQYGKVMVERKEGEATKMVASDNLVKIPVDLAMKLVVANKGQLPK